ncbi:unnamed protein product [Owenia fusiformis]|uniref:G-protein coupled receptors family 1 profile domain-containing protein n=1 Tax=Owenia fusiformis TaxID=6347 RepID=A0A8S4N5I2_OWEFU|nr:unnamed protein product [Owenia fusiformis]
MAEFHMIQRYVAGVVTPFIGGFGILFNISVLMTLIRRQERTQLWFLLVFLSVVHLVISGYHSTLSIVVAVATGLRGITHVFTDSMCSVVGVCSYILDNVSILLLALIAVDRWNAIFRPATYINIGGTLSKWNKFLIAGCFITPALFGSLAIFGGFTFNPVAGKCAVGHRHLLITTTYTFLFRFAPILLLLGIVLKLCRPLGRFESNRQQGVLPTEPIIIEPSHSYNATTFEFPSPNSPTVVAPIVSGLELRATKSMVSLLIAGIVIGSLEMIVILLGMDLLVELLTFQYLFTMAYPSIIPLMLLTQKNMFNAMFRRLIGRCTSVCTKRQENAGRARLFLDPHFHLASNDDVEKSCSINNQLPEFLKQSHIVDVNVSTVETDPPADNRVIIQNRKESENFLHPHRASLQAGNHRAFENDDVSSIDSLRVMIDADKWSLSACSTITLSRPDRRHSLSPFAPRKTSQFSTCSERKQRAKLSNAFSHNFALEIRGKYKPTSVSPMPEIVTDSTHFSASFDLPETPTSPSARVSADVTRWIRSSGTDVNGPNTEFRTCFSLQENVSGDNINISTSNSSLNKAETQKSNTSTPNKAPLLKKHTSSHSQLKHVDLLPSVEH